MIPQTAILDRGADDLTLHPPTLFLLPPFQVYATMSFLALVFGSEAIYFNTIRDV